MREREVQLPVNRNSYPSSNGRGLEAGQSRPSNTLYLRVRIGDIGDDLYAIFINDMSEQRRFEAVRRDFCDQRFARTQDSGRCHRATGRNRDRRRR